MDDYTPLYIQLKEMILQRIKDGEYLPGEKIPSERKMAEIYKINRMTVKNAINALVKEGILYKTGNSGTYVAKRKPETHLYMNDIMHSNYTGLTAMVHTKGFELQSKVLEKSVVTNKRYLEGKLSLSPGEEIYALHRLRNVEGENIALEYSYIPLKFFEDIAEHDFRKASLYDYMDTKGHMPTEFIQKMYVNEAKWPTDKIMKIELGTPLYIMEYVGKDKEGNVVEYTLSKMRCDKAVFAFEVGVDQ